jgi:hypothetical protein
MNYVPHREAVPLIVGRAVHSALAVHYAKKDIDPEAYIKQTFDQTKGKAAWLQAEIDDLDKQQDYTIQMYRWYKEQYPRESWTVLAPEVEGHVPLGSHQFYFRIDMLISWLGHPWLFETKTTSQLGPTFFRKFRLDPQLSLYSYAAGKALGVMPKGALINAIKKSRKLDRAEFERQAITRTTDQIDVCVAQTIQQVNVMEMMAVKATELLTQEQHEAAAAMYQMHFNECVRYNRSCDYHELCSGQIRDPLDLFSIRTADYTEREEEEES